MSSGASFRSWWSFLGRNGEGSKKKKPQLLRAKPMLGSKLRKVWSKKRRSTFLSRTRLQLMDHYWGDCGPLVGAMEISMAPWCPLHLVSRYTCVPLDCGASGAELLQCPSCGCSSPWKEALSSPTLFCVPTLSPPLFA